MRHRTDSLAFSIPRLSLFLSLSLSLSLYLYLSFSAPLVVSLCLTWCNRID
jgi:hypothetical protein